MMWNGEGLMWIWVCGMLALVIVLRRWGTTLNVNEEKGRFPPGPLAWPVIGHLHLLHNLPHQALRDLSTKYGHMLGLRFGQQRAVVVSSPELAKLVLLTHDQLFADRPPYRFVSSLFYGSHNGIGFSSYGPRWRKHRKLCMLALFTAKRLQELQHVRHEELRVLLQRIHEESGAGTRAVDIGRCVGQMSSNLITRLLQSRATRREEGEDLQELVKEIEHGCSSPSIGDLIPCLAWLDFWTMRHLRSVHSRVDKVLTAILTERKQSTSTHHDDLLHALLSKEVGQTVSSSPEETLTMDEIKGIMMDMLAAGIHTISLTSEWAMAELLRNPQCLYRLQREIDTVVGKKKQLTDADVSELSYLKCVVKEVFRLHPVAPLLVPRISREQCKIHGYTIPADTLMLVNVWAIGRDEQVWQNANHFTPERFEDKETDLKGLHFELLPFGSGRRICLGLPLGLSVVEVTLANLVNNFDWELPPGETSTSLNMNEKTGLTANKATPMMAIPKLRVPSSKMS